MFTFDLLIPWISFGITIWLLLTVQRWIHRHLFGMGFLLSKEKHAATFFYYLLLAPGVFLHEISHYLMAGVFGVGHKKFDLFPQAQEDGSLEMGFIELEEIKNPVHAAFIGIAPLLTGMAAVVFISNSLLNLPQFFFSFQTGDITVISAAFLLLIRRPDFLLWTYILFAVSNAMMPNAEDRRGWWIIGAGAVIFLVFLTVIGFQYAVVTWLSDPIPKALYSLSTVFGTVLALDSVAIAIIWIIERILERATGHQVQYRPALPATTARGPKFQSVYDLALPLPPPPGRALKAAQSKLPAADRPAKPKAPALAGSPQPMPGGFARPAPKPGEKPGELKALPAGSKPANPISGPPALARPASPAAPGKSNLPAITSGARPTPFGARPAPTGKDDDDYIDADVIDEDEDEAEYVDDDDV